MGGFVTGKGAQSPPELGGLQVTQYRFERRHSFMHKNQIIALGKERNKIQLFLYCRGFETERYICLSRLNGLGDWKMATKYGSVEMIFTAIGVRGIHQHHANHFFRVQVSESPYDQPAIRVPCQDIMTGYGRLLQRSAQVFCTLLLVLWSGGWIAPA